MYFRRKTSAGRAYLQIVESRRDGDQVRQQVIATLGRYEELQESGQLERLLRSGARFASKAMVLSAIADDSAMKIASRHIGPGWSSSGCGRRPAAGQSSRDSAARANTALRWSRRPARLITTASIRVCTIARLPGHAQFRPHRPGRAALPGTRPAGQPGPGRRAWRVNLGPLGAEEYLASVSSSASVRTPGVRSRHCAAHCRSSFRASAREPPRIDIGARRRAAADPRRLAGSACGTTSSEM